jgi:hypothetical protein
MAKLSVTGAAIVVTVFCAPWAAAYKALTEAA